MMKLRYVLIPAGALALAAVGGVAGAALAGVPIVPSPVGLTAAPGVATTPMPDPTYPTNGDGLTYGSAAQANAPDAEPDLIAVVADNGKEGYVLKHDLDEADGTAAAATFTSPDQALAWQANRLKQGSVDVPVYLADGTTQIGMFTVTPTAPMEGRPQQAQ